MNAQEMDRLRSLFPMDARDCMNCVCFMDMIAGSDADMRLFSLRLRDHCVSFGQSRVDQTKPERDTREKFANTLSVLVDCARDASTIIGRQCTHLAAYTTVLQPDTQIDLFYCGIGLCTYSGFPVQIRNFEQSEPEATHEIRHCHSAA